MNDQQTQRPISSFKGNRPPDWRWQWAVQLKAEGFEPNKPVDKRKKKKKKPPAIDPLVLKTLKYLRVKTDPKAHFSDWRAVDELICEADSLHDEAGQKRWAIEALAVAGEDPEVMAKYFRLPVEIITTYEKLFFDVREFTDSPGYFHHTILRGLATSAISKDDQDRCWKLVAMAGGVGAIRAWWDMGPSSAEWHSWIERAQLFQGKKNGYAAQVGYDVNRFTARYVIENAIKSQQVEIQRAQAGIGGDDAQKGATEMLSNLDFTIAGMVNTKTALPRIEPRAEDLLRQRLALITVKQEEQVKQLPPAQELK